MNGHEIACYTMAIAIATGGACGLAPASSHHPLACGRTRANAVARAKSVASTASGLHYKLILRETNQT